MIASNIIVDRGGALDIHSIISIACNDIAFIKRNSHTSDRIIRRIDYVYTFAAVTQLIATIGRIGRWIDIGATYVGTN